MNKPFKTKKERLEWQKERFLTTGKLIEWLSKFPSDTLIYSIEPNTNSYQEIPSVEKLMYSKKDAKEDYSESLKRWYGGTAAQVKTEMDNMFRYMLDKDGVCVKS